MDVSYINGKNVCNFKFFCSIFFLLKLIHSIFYYLQTLIILIKVYYENVHSYTALEKKIFSLICYTDIIA